MKLLWVGNHFICEDLYPPFIVENDNEYYKSLLGKFSIVIKQAKMAGADVASLKILNKFRSKILEALRCYYSADLAKCNTIILNLLKDIGQDSIAVSRLQESCAFPGQMNKELQFFRCRKGNPSISFSTKDIYIYPVHSEQNREIIDSASQEIQVYIYLIHRMVVGLKQDFCLTLNLM